MSQVTKIVVCLALLLSMGCSSSGSKKSTTSKSKAFDLMQECQVLTKELGALTAERVRRPELKIVGYKIEKPMNKTLESIDTSKLQLQMIESFANNKMAKAMTESDAGVHMLVTSELSSVVKANAQSKRTQYKLKIRVMDIEQDLVVWQKSHTMVHNEQR